MRRRRLCLEALEDRSLLSASLLQDINILSDSSSPGAMVALGGRFYFAANGGIDGRELWASDGTPAGTLLVKEIYPGGSSSDPQELVVVGDTLFFTADDGVNGRELWKSDGTPDGTVLVKDICAGGSSPGLQEMTNVNGTLFFSATDGVNGQELWTSDGTPEGTVLVADIYSGSSSSSPVQLTDVGGTLFFAATDGVNGQELWVSDGTAEGTVLVKDIWPGSSSSAPEQLTYASSMLYFTANTANEGRELWKSDGTAAGTVLVSDIRAGSSSSTPQRLKIVTGTLFFTALTSGAGTELWKSNGTAAGTVLVKDINPGSSSSNPQQLTTVGGTLFFSASTASEGTELWKSDGTAAGTVLVKDIRPGSGSSFPQWLTEFNAGLFFVASNGLSGEELWKSDGTSAGTALIKDVYAGSSSSSPQQLIGVSGTLFFTAVTAHEGRELWASDGTEAGTVSVRDINRSTLASSPAGFVGIEGTVFFSAADGVNGGELWSSEGTGASTMLIQDIYAGSNGSSPQELIDFNGTLVFSASDAAAGRELWKSDGTAEGTVLVKDIYAGSTSSIPSQFRNVNGTLFFAAGAAGTGWELWKSDGTAEGTVLVKDIHAGSISSDPQELVRVGSTLYFTANDGAKGRELWKSDGTTEGTVMVKDLYAGSSSSSPQQLTAVGGRLFFAASAGGTGEELWTSDGTAAGTVLVKDIYTGGNSSYPHELTAVGGTLYFSAETAAASRELWASDGTPEGTVLVKDIYPGSSPSNPEQLLDVNGVLLFAATTEAGRELWTSDGTSTGTVLVKDIYTGSGSSSPGGLTNLGGTLYFAADDGIHGRELWASDGTPDGTMLAADIRPGIDSSSPRSLKNVNGTLYLAADDGLHGAEAWFLLLGTAPVNVLLTDAAVDENEPVGTAVGTLATLDPTPADTFNYALVAGAGDTDNASFTIAGDQLKTAATFNYELKSSYSVRVRSTDAGAEWVEKRLAIEILDVNEPPTLSAISTLRGNAENAALDIRNTVLSAAGDAQDEDSDVLSFRVESVTSGTLTKGGVPVTPSETLLGPGETWIWTPPADTFGVLEAFTVVAFDGELASAAAVPVSVEVAASTAYLLKDVNPNTFASSPADFLDVEGTVFFTADDGATGRELWKSDGTAESTVLVKDIDAGSGSSSPTHLSKSGGTLFFAATTADQGQELWKSDGTPAGTVLVKDINPGSGSSFLAFLSDVGGTLFFAAYAPGQGLELWKSDGTTEGTVMVKDIYPGSFSSYPHSLVELGGALYFSATDGATGGELWKSDGTPEGTVMVKDLDAGSSSSNPQQLISVGDRLFFTASKAGIGNELWTSDGTPEGTRLVKDIYAGSLSSEPLSLTNVGGKLFFSARTSAADRELWTSDGTAAGTVMVKDIFPGKDSSDPQLLVDVGGTLFFAATDGVQGQELWTSDGTAAGTVQVKDIFASNGSSTPQQLTNAGGTLYFTADDGINGRELWASDGTPNGTMLAANIHAEIDSSSPASLKNVNGMLHLAADDGLHGVEPWVLLQGTAPVNVQLSSTSVPENEPVGTVVGTLSTLDPTVGDTFAYALVTGVGDADNASFTIAGNQLKTAATFNYEVRSSYSARVRSTDAAGQWMEKRLMITIVDVNEAPILTVVETQTGAGENGALGIRYAILAGAADAEDPEGDVLSFRVESVASGTLTKNGAAVTPGQTLLGPGETWVWTPPTDTTGTIEAFSVTVFDGELDSGTPVTVSVQVVPWALELVFAHSVIGEADGPVATTATISRIGDNTADLVIAIANPDRTELYLPATVTIPALESSVQFSIQVVNDGEVDGNQTPLVSASAAGYPAVETPITVADDDTPGDHTLGGHLFGAIAAEDYRVLFDILIDAGEVLTIAPGSILRFLPDTRVLVQGQLSAVGAHGSRIVFTSSETTAAPGDWKGVRLENAGQPRTTMDYVEVAYAVTGVGVIPQASSPVLLTLSHSEIHHCSGTALTVSPGEGQSVTASGVQILDNWIHHNSGNAVYLSAHTSGCSGGGNAATLTGNEISDNAGAGVSAWATAGTSYCTPRRSSSVTGTIAGNFIHHNQQGIYAYSAQSYLLQNGTHISMPIENNLIVDNVTAGIVLGVSSSYASLNARVINNTIAGNGTTGISHSAETDTGFSILNNVITNNGTGIQASTAYSPAAASVGYNDVYGNSTANWVNYPSSFGDLTTTNANGTPADAEMNISADPRFVAADDFHLSFASPAIDAGTAFLAPGDDFEDDLRSGPIDLGWDEVVKPTVAPLTTSYQRPGLSGTVAQADVNVTVRVDGQSYAATNHGNGTWSLAQDTISPPLDLGTYDVQVVATDAAGDSITDDTVGELVIATLTVTSLTPGVSGFAVAFNGPIDAAVLNLYDSAAQLLGPADVTLQGAATGLVRGSLVVSDSNQRMTFVGTAGLLPADTYTVTLRSADNGFRTAAGVLLDGNADGTVGDDYSTTFTVAPLPAGAVTVSLPDFACGVGQPLNFPASAAGLPVQMANAAGVTSLAVDVAYDPALLSITAGSRASGIPTDWTVAVDTSTTGVAKVTASGTTPLSGTVVEVVRLTAAVPDDAPYGAVQAIQLKNTSVNGGAAAAAGDAAVHKAAYLGDADGSGIHSSADAFLTVQAALGLASGFEAHAWTDPRIVGDADGSGLLSAADAFLIVQEGLGIAEPFVPDNPHITITPVGGGFDPQFQIDVNLPGSEGGVVTVPVKLAIEPTATNVGAIDFDLLFDPSRLTIQLPGGVSAGADTAGWAVSPILVAPGQLRVGMVSSSGQPLPVGLREIARLQFHVQAEESSRTGWQPVRDGLPTRPTLPPPITDRRLPITDVLDGSETHPTLLDVEPVDPRAGGYTWTAADGSLLISPGMQVLDKRVIADAEARPMRFAEVASRWGSDSDPADAVDGSQDGVFPGLPPELAALDCVLDDIVRDTAAAWR